MVKTGLAIAAAIVGVVIISIVLGVINSTSSVAKENLAQCLTDSGVKMYGAYWCPHCQSQKSMFGSSFDRVNYIECSLPNRGGMTVECREEGIEGYPTWEFAPGDRESRVFTLEELSQRTGCELIDE